MSSTTYSQASLFSVLQPAVDPTDTGAPWQETPFEEAEFLVLDLETTGLSAKRNSITEITAIKFKASTAGEGVALAMFSTLVRPAEPIPPEVEDLTGISNDMVRQAPPLIMVLNDLLQFMGSNPIVVGHNVSFDIEFLREKCESTGLLNGSSLITLERAFCTRRLAQKLLPGLPSYQGIVVATQCGYHNDNPHRAEADVRMAAAILFSLAEKARQQGHSLKTLGDLQQVQGVLR
jgi:DNA polymerase III epsilon subunit-like protein